MNVKIAQRLAELRHARGYSQESLARELGLSRQAVSKWERADYGRFHQRLRAREVGWQQQLAEPEKSIRDGG